MTVASRTGASSRSWRVAASFLEWLVAATVLMREAAVVLGAPLWRLLSRIRILARLSAWVGGLGRWSVVGVLALPLAVAEPLKLVGLYWCATGHLGWGVALQAAGHGLSLLLVERILVAGHVQLMTFRWFAALHGWFIQVRAAALTWPPILAAFEIAKAGKASVTAIWEGIRLKLSVFER